MSVDGDFIRTLNHIEPDLGDKWHDAHDPDLDTPEARDNAWRFYEDAVNALTIEQRFAVTNAEDDRDHHLWGTPHTPT